MWVGYGGSCLESQHSGNGPGAEVFPIRNQTSFFFFSFDRFGEDQTTQHTFVSDRKKELIYNVK